LAEKKATEESNGLQPAEAGLSRIVLDARMAKVAK
jgi:hypothetical protein